MKNQEKKEGKPFGNKRKVAAASIGLLAAAALIVGTLIPSAAEVVSPSGIVDPPAIVLQLEEDMAQTEQTAPENRKAARLSERVKGWILGLPQAVRLLLVLPLWGLGTFLSSAASTLWAGLFSPVLGFVMSWILGAAILVGSFGLAAKLLFPNLPLRKIFSKRNLLALGAVALLLVAADGILPLYWPEYPLISMAVKAALSLGLVALLLYRLKMKNSLTFS